MAPEKLTVYEQLRNENIKRNQEMLARLKIQSRVSEFSAFTKRPRAQSKSYQESSEKKQKSKSRVVLRRSLRIQGMPPDSSTANKDSQPTTKKSPQESMPINIRDAYSGDFDVSNKKLIETIKGFSHKIDDEGMDKNSVGACRS